MPLICIVHCNDEASRKIPHCRFDSEGGVPMMKNVAFADMVMAFSSYQIIKTFRSRRLSTWYFSTR